MALIQHGRKEAMPAEVAVVVSPRSTSPAAERAIAEGVPVATLASKEPDYAERLVELLAQHQIDIVCLAGYMTLLPEAVLESFPGRVLNIHPALLPKHGGKGMYGHFVHEAVIEAGDRESGCSIHVVTKQYDEGPVIHQLRCPVLPGDTPELLAERVLRLEQQAYAEAVGMLWRQFAG